MYERGTSLKDLVGVVPLALVELVTDLMILAVVLVGDM